MSQRALTAPARPLALPGAADGSMPDDVAIIAAARVRPRVGSWWLWTAAAITLLAGAAALVVWARTLPSFDAYGWLSWGQQTWHGGLDTNAAPSWKPLPYMFTVVYAVLGHHLELRLWMATSAAVAFAGVVFAGRIAYRLTAPRAERAWAGWVAAAFAGLALLALRDELHYGYLHYVLSSQSDPMIVTFLLASIDLALSGHRRAAFACGVLASLGRPEVWPFLALYSAWLWRRDHRDRWLITGAWVALLALWFGIPAISSRTPFVSAANALDSGRAPSGDRVTAVLSRFGELQHWPAYVAAVLCVALAAARRSSPRDRAALALAGGIVVWLAIEVAFGLHGWPALGRYMFEPAAVATVLAGAFVGRVLAADWRQIASSVDQRGVAWARTGSSPTGSTWLGEPWRFTTARPYQLAKVRHQTERGDPHRAVVVDRRGGAGDLGGRAGDPDAGTGHPSGGADDPGAGTGHPSGGADDPGAGTGHPSGETGGSGTATRIAHAGALGGALLLLALVAAMIPAAVSAVRAERSDLTHQHARTAEIEALPGVIARLRGAARLRGCGEPLTRLQYQTALAFALGDNVSQVGFKYSEALAHGNPVLFITPFESGVGWQAQAAHQTAPACAALPKTAANL